jgi:hypothetical protein
MARQKKKLSLAQKAAKKKRQKEYMTIFVHGKQKRVKRPVTIDGMDIEEFIRRNADPPLSRARDRAISVRCFAPKVVG